MMNKETRVIEQIKNGEPEAYRELVERYQAGLIIHCENLLKDRQQGEDIAQEAFIKAYVNLKKFSEDKSKFSTWLYRIATNLCIDYLRKHKQTANIEDIESLTQTVDPASLHTDEITQLRDLVETLEPPKYAAIIKAYFWDGKSYQDIADQYDTSTNTIGTWISRAKQQLKEKLS